MALHILEGIFFFYLIPNLLAKSISGRALSASYIVLHLFIFMVSQIIQNGIKTKRLVNVICLNDESVQYI